MSDKHDGLDFETLAIRAGQTRTAELEHSEPIFPTSSYIFENAATAAARFSEPGNIYSRFTNPTVRTFEQRLAALEGGECCVATSSGMAAILAACMALLKTGDHVICSRSVFGTTTVLFSTYLAKFGIETTFVPLADLDSWEQAIRSETQLLFLETPSNPLTELVDIRSLADLAHANGCLLWWITVFARRPCNSRWHWAQTLSSTRPPSTSMVRVVALAGQSSVMKSVSSARMSSVSCVPPVPR